jgi:hypothetical protein
MKCPDLDQSLSTDAINVIVESSAKNSVRVPIDPKDPDYPRLLDLKRRLDDAKKKKKGRDANER